MIVTKTIDVSTLAGFRRAERLQSLGWKAVAASIDSNTGHDTIVMQKTIEEKKRGTHAPQRKQSKRG